MCKTIRNTPQKGGLRINFDGVQEIAAGGMLLLYAEIYRLIAQNVKVTMKYPSDESVEKVLQHIGLISMLDMDERIPKAKISEESINTWQVIKGLKFVGEDIDKFLHELTRIDKKKRSNLYTSIKEVIANAAEHAYAQSAETAHVPNDDMEKTHFWVMFGKQEKAFLDIVIGDLGQGIPATIKKKKMLLGLTREEKNHSKLIKHATNLGESMVKNAPHRGKGLAEVVEDIPKVGGSVWIFSGNGMFSEGNFTPHGKSRRIEGRNLKFDLKGTVVQFRVPISELRK